MIKRFFMACVSMAMLLGMQSCMTAQNGTGATGGSTADILGSLGGGSQNGNSGANVGGLLGDLLSGLIGDNTKVTEKTLQGTWKYLSPDCRFETEDALAKAGGAVAAQTVEQKLGEVYAKVGINPSSCSFTFGENNTCAVTFGGRTISGTYTLNPDTRDLSIVSSTGLIRLNGKVYFDLKNLTILFDANKLLSAVQMVAAFTGKSNSSIGALSTLLNNYEGMMIGMNLSR